MTLDKSIRIGVDVGGTNTDAVAVDVALASRGHPERGVLAFKKTPTTPDATSGIETAVRAVLQSPAERAGGTINPERIASVTVGTTHFINSVVERDLRRLQKVAVIRLSRSFLREVPPFADFPQDLAAILYGYCGIVDGGLHIDGSQEAPLREAQVVAECRKIRALGLTAVVVAGVFSPIDETFHQEDRAREIVLRKLPGADVVCSHELANIGLLERENASGDPQLREEDSRAFQAGHEEAGPVVPAVYHTERRHDIGLLFGRQDAHQDVLLGRDQLYARRRVPVRARRGRQQVCCGG